jgi:CheY-like chemotaxis protein
MPKTNVLIVDDNKESISIYRKRLENEGCQVDATSSGVEALKKVKDKKYDVALLDYLLSDIPGEKLAFEMKRLDDKIKIMLLSEEPELKYRIYC